VNFINNDNYSLYGIPYIPYIGISNVPIFSTHKPTKYAGYLESSEFFIKPTIKILDISRKVEMSAPTERDEIDKVASSRFYTTSFVLFSLVNAVAAKMNHIDDTDETYGYWEPLHFLLFGRGMQTWEYAPGVCTYYILKNENGIDVDYIFHV